MTIFTHTIKSEYVTQITTVTGQAKYADSNTYHIYH